MTVLLTHNAYGKSRVRLTKIERHPDRHDLFEWSVDLQLEGQFTLAYTVGENLNVVATDTMKNTVYALAADAPLESPEAFGLRLAATGRAPSWRPTGVSSPRTVRPGTATRCQRSRS